VLASFALFVMPNSPALWIAAGMLWILDASINISMEPFRAFVGDQLPAATAAHRLRDAELLHRRGLGGGEPAAVAAGQGGRRQHRRRGRDPGHGALRVLFRWRRCCCGAIGWTVLRTREYPPEQLACLRRCAAAGNALPGRPRFRQHDARAGPCLARCRWRDAACVAFGRAGAIELYVLAGLVAGYGSPCCCSHTAHATAIGFWPASCATCTHMPDHAPARRGAVLLVVRAVRDVDLHHRGGDLRCTSAAAIPRRSYNDGANWVGVLFAAYNGFAALAAIAIPHMVRALGPAPEPPGQPVSLGGGGLLSISGSAIRTGCCCRCWASASPGPRSCRLPYALLSDSLPARKMGVYMGIFNFFIVIPQLVAASLLGFLLKLFDNAPIQALLIGGISFIVSGVCVLRVRSWRAPCATRGKSP
jgi:maltose/moltooligosaccharide transporter